MAMDSQHEQHYDQHDQQEDEKETTNIEMVVSLPLDWEKQGHDDQMMRQMKIKFMVL